MSDVEQLGQTLSNLPQRGAPYDDRYRCLVEGNYLIFYRIKETADETLAIIVAVVHGSRDIERVLSIPLTTSDRISL